ncbi:MAG TPA: hypothetical protein VEC99_07190, partial [Clostridia bacterium]|nr:hypothetical protein [Clostridia bacterium]
QRIDLYVDPRAFRPCVSASELPASSFSHTVLDFAIREFNQLETVLPDHKSALLHKIFLHYEGLTAGKSKGEARAAKQSLLHYLLSSLPGISRNGQSIRRWFNDNYRSWLQGGKTAEAITDGRSNNAGRPSYACPECEQKIRTLAKNLRGERGLKGNVSLAVKMMLENEALCPKCTERRRHFGLTTVERTRVTPNRIEVAATKGPDRVRKVAPTHHCDWSGEMAGNYFVIDDMTTNEIAYDIVDGKMIHGQAQLLFTEDEFSGYPLPFLLYFGPPNSVTIKKALHLVFTRIGLPHSGLITERGVFNNRMLSGEGRAKDELGMLRLDAALQGLLKQDDEELERLRRLELGLRDPAYGLSIIQACSPQAKTVERTFFEFQKRASILPGFAGFQQRAEKPKRLVDFERRVIAGKEHPGNEYTLLSDLRKNYEGICWDLANEKVNGVRHRGRTRLEVWQDDIGRHPLRQLPREIEALFAARRIPDVKVHSTGIKIRLNKFEDGFYYNDHTGSLVDRRVTVHINYDIPEFIHIEHPDTGKLLKVKRDKLSRHGATPEEIAESNAARRAHISGAAAQSGNIDNLITSWIVRDSDYSEADKEKGRTIMNDVAEQKSQAKVEHQLWARLRRNCEILGEPVPERVRDLEAHIEAQELEMEVWGMQPKKVDNE